MILLSPRLAVANIVVPAMLVLLVALVGAGIGGGVERALIVFFISLTVVVGIGLYSGNSGILSFGHLSFMGLAAYASAILTLPINMKKLTLPNLPGFLADIQLEFVVSMLVSALLVMVFALLVGLVISRLEGSAATIATLALLIIVHGVIIGARDFTRGSQSFFGVSRDTDIWVAAGVCLFSIIVARFFRDSVPGLKLRAARDDAIAAGSNGIGIRGERLLAWVVSAGLVALAGVALGHFLGAFSPKKFYFVDTFALLAMLIVGGMSTVTGAVVGATVITLATEVLRRLEGGVELLGLQLPEVFGLTQIGIGVIILLVMFKRGGGLAGADEWDERLLDRWLPASGNATPSGHSMPGEEVASTASEDDEKLLADSVTMRFGGLTAVDGVSLQLAPREIVGLIGPNGSGKTTLLNLLSGVLSPGEGGVFRGDKPIGNTPLRRFADLG